MKFSERSLAALNSRDDYRAQANAASLAPNSAQLVIGQWDGLGTYENAGAGIAVHGHPSLPVLDLRLTNSLLGLDGDVELFLDTHDKDHVVTGGLFELKGTFGIHAACNKPR